MTAVVAGSAAASYSTGGGGVVLEHQYGATLLAALLTGDPLPELGDDVTPMVVRFQARAVSDVDDLLISGHTPDGGVRQVSVGVRRAPKLVKSEGKSVRLVASYLKVIAGAWEEILAGRWRLGLAAVASNSAVRQVDAEGVNAQLVQVGGDVPGSAAHVRHWPAAGGVNQVGEQRQGRPEVRFPGQGLAYLPGIADRNRVVGGPDVCQPAVCVHARHGNPAVRISCTAGAVAALLIPVKASSGHRRPGRPPAN